LCPDCLFCTRAQGEWNRLDNIDSEATRKATEKETKKRKAAKHAELAKRWEDHRCLRNRYHACAAEAAYKARKAARAVAVLRQVDDDFGHLLPGVIEDLIAETLDQMDVFEETAATALWAAEREAAEREAAEREAAGLVLLTYFHDLSQHYLGCLGNLHEFVVEKAEMFLSDYMEDIAPEDFLKVLDQAISDSSKFVKSFLDMLKEWETGTTRPISEDLAFDEVFRTPLVDIREEVDGTELEEMLGRFSYRFSGYGDEIKTDVSDMLSVQDLLLDEMSELVSKVCSM
jgi:hypothetical protein